MPLLRILCLHLCGCLETLEDTFVWLLHSLCCRRRGLGRLLSFQWKENSFLSNQGASQKPAMLCYFPGISSPFQDLGSLIKRKKRTLSPPPTYPPHSFTGWLFINCFLPTYGWVTQAFPAAPISALWLLPIRRRLPREPQVPVSCHPPESRPNLHWKKFLFQSSADFTILQPT